MENKKHFYINTFGCQMNKHDSERIAGMLQQEGYELTNCLEEANLVVFNTCTVRDHADRKLYGHLQHLKQWKTENKDRIIAVGGCLAQKEGKRIQEKIPYLDIVFGTHNLGKFPHLLNEYRKSSTPLCELSEELEVMPSNLPCQREYPFKAWVTITVGCNNYCSYCIVPYVRGREISRPLEDIIKEVEFLVEDGVIEITLLGQNVNSYGYDLYDKSKFAYLLGKLNEIKELERIRFTTSHPKDLTSDIIQAVADSESICEHFHLPIQSGSNKILKLMNREYTKEAYLDIIKNIRTAMPECSITTDIMVGFPGEGEQEFLETFETFKKIEFDQAYMFIFSPRGDTPASKLKDSETKEAKKERFLRLVDLQNNITSNKNKSLEGKTFEILVEGRSKKNPQRLTGRTRTNRIVNFHGEEDLIGKLVKIKITKSQSYSLIGELEEKYVSESRRCRKKISGIINPI